MISTSILYCNKLDALPLERNHHSSGSTTDSPSFTSGALSGSGLSTAHGNFRVRYLGSTSCNLNGRRLKDGISAFQKSLIQIYTSARRRAVTHRSIHPLALNQVLDVCGYGVVVAEADPTIIRINRGTADTVVTKVITPLSNILLWASVRFNTKVTGKRRVFGAAFVPLSCSEAVLNKDSFVALSSKQRFLVGLPHPPLFVCVLQKVATPRILECHMFVCASAEDAINLSSLLGDVQKHCSKVGSLEVPLPGQMGSYSYKSLSTARSTPDVHRGRVRGGCMTSDTQSDSSRVVSPTSASSYKTRQTSSSSKSRSKYRALYHQHIQKKHSQQHPHERKTQIEDIHSNTRNALLPPIPPKPHDYRYKFMDANNMVISTTPTMSSVSEKHHYHRNNHLKEKQYQHRYQSRVNNNRFSNNNYNNKFTHFKGVKRVNNITDADHQVKSDAITRLTSSKCGTSSDSYGECQSGTKDKSSTIIMKSAFVEGINNKKMNCNSKVNCGKTLSVNPMKEMALNGIEVARRRRNVYNGYCVDVDDHADDYPKNEVKTKMKTHIKEYKVNSAIVNGQQNRKKSATNGHAIVNSIVAADSSLESSSNSEIVVKDNVIQSEFQMDNRKYRLQNGTSVPNSNHTAISKTSPKHRYFGDSIRGAKSFEMLNSSNIETDHICGKKSPPSRVSVPMKNAMTSCKDAPWMMNKKKPSMVMSKTIFLGSESDSKKSSSMSDHASSTKQLQWQRTKSKSSPNLVNSSTNTDESNDEDIFLHGAKDLVPVTYKNRIKSASKSHGSAHHKRQAQHTNAKNNYQNNKNYKTCITVYLPEAEVKGIKSFNSRSNVKQWSTMSLSSDIDTNRKYQQQQLNQSAPSQRPNFYYNSAFLEQGTIPLPVPRVLRWNSIENSTRKRSGLLSRLRQMSLKSWLNARKGTRRLFSKFRNSKRKIRKKYSNTSSDSAVDVQDVTLPRKYHSNHNLSSTQQLSSLRRQQSWSFQDFSERYPQNSNACTDTSKPSSPSSPSSPSPTPTPQLNHHQRSTAVDNAIEECTSEQTGAGTIEMVHNHLVNGDAIITKKIPVIITNIVKGSNNHPVRGNNSNTNGIVNGHSMSSDSGVEEIECLSSTDVSNSLNSRNNNINNNNDNKKQFSARNRNHNELLGRDYNYQWRHLQYKSGDINHRAANERKFQMWSKTDIQQELGYMP